MNRERKVDLRAMSKEEQDALGVRIGEKIRQIIDQGIDELAKKINKPVKFTYEVEESKEAFCKKRITKKNKDFDVKSAEQAILEKVNKITNIYGLKTSLTLHKE